MDLDIYIKQLNNLTHDIRKLIKEGYDKQQLQALLTTARQLKQQISQNQLVKKSYIDNLEKHSRKVILYLKV